MYYRYLSLDVRHTCSCGERSYIRAQVGDEIAYLCAKCAKEAKDAWESERPNAPFPHKIDCRRNARNTFSPYDPFEGHRVNKTGKPHRFTGLSARPDKLVKLSGSEHVVFATDERAKELRIGPYAEASQ